MKFCMMTVGFAILAACGTWAQEPPLPTDDVCVPIRPGDPDKNVPFWNGQSARFIWAPAFEFEKTWEAKSYRFRVYDKDDRVHVFTAETPWAALSPVWRELPVGPCHVVCEGLNEKGQVTGYAGLRAFWKSQPFAGRSGERKRAYAEAAAKAFDYVLDCKSSRYFLDNGKPDPTYHINGYPSKMHASVICAMTRMAQMRPVRKDEAMRLATLSAEFLLKTAERPDAPLANWPQTYWTNDNQVCARPALSDTIMALYPAVVGVAFADLADATGEAKWLAAAERIADTYFKIRREDGAWPLVVERGTGKARGTNTVVPTDLIAFFERLHKATGREAYRETADSCFRAVESGPFRDWAWEGQFEDVGPGKKYRNLTKHNACNALIYMLGRFPGDAGKLAIARDIIRFAEDQFVFWEVPCLEDGRCVCMPNGDGLFRGPGRNWLIPAVAEQYECYTPVDASAAKLIRSWLAMYRATGERIHLEKARALADRMTTVQCEDGFVSTWWNGTHYDGWMNCNISSANVLLEMDETERAEARLKSN